MSNTCEAYILIGTSSKRCGPNSTPIKCLTLRGCPSAKRSYLALDPRQAIRKRFGQQPRRGPRRPSGSSSRRGPTLLAIFRLLLHARTALIHTLTDFHRGTDEQAPRQFWPCGEISEVLPVLTRPTIGPSNIGLVKENESLLKVVHSALECRVDAISIFLAQQIALAGKLADVLKRAAVWGPAGGPTGHRINVIGFLDQDYLRSIEQALRQK